MSIRQHPTKGAGHWYIDIGYGKDRIRLHFEGTLDEAKDVEVRARRQRGYTVTTTDPRIREIAADYLATYKLDHQPEGYERQQRSVATIVEFFGIYNLSSVSPALIEKYKYQRIETVKPTTVNKELCALSSLYKWAIEREMIDKMPRIKKFPAKLTQAPVNNVPETVDFMRILDYIPARIRGLFRLMVLYGLRSGEARKLRVENVNLESQTFWVMGKGGKIRTLPICDPDTAQELADRVANATDGWLWYSPRTKGCYKDIGESLTRAARKAGYTGKIYPHLLRHGAATELVGRTDLRTAMEILGHSNISVTEKYLHVRKHRIQNALTGYVNF